MQKLSKEQADWVLQKFNVTHNYLMKKPSEGMFHILDCREIINQCTEKEFPEFEMQIRHEETIKLYADIDEDRTILVGSWESNVSEFSPSQFKQFALGVNEILKWLEEQQ